MTAEVKGRDIGVVVASVGKEKLHMEPGHAHRLPDARLPLAVAGVVGRGIESQFRQAVGKGHVRVELPHDPHEQLEIPGLAVKVIKPAHARVAHGRGIVQVVGGNPGGALHAGKG